jgi:hypothetical protein
MADIIFIVLMILHIGSIIAWLGGATVFVSVVTPSLRRVSSQARAEFIISALPSYVRFIMGASGLGIVAGVLLYGYVSEIAISLAPSPVGIPLVQAGAVLGLIAFLIPIVVLAPTSRRLVVLAKKSQAPASETAGSNSAMTEMANLQRRMMMSSSVGVGLLLLTLILMVAGATV